MDYILKLNGKDVRLVQDENKVAVRFKTDVPRSMRAEAVSSNSNALADFGQRIEVPNEKYTLLPIVPSNEANIINYTIAMNTLQDHQNIAKVNPVFKIEDKTVIVTDRLLVGLSEGIDPTKLLGSFEKYELLSSAPGAREYIVHLNENQDALEQARELSEVQGVEYAEPDFVTMGPHLARQPLTVRRADLADDPLVEKQYAPRITQAVEAWKLQKGDKNVKIAILDEGVDIGHEDLKSSMLGGYDGTDNDSFQEPNAWDGHGTACAGLAAAVHDNKIGIKGIGGGCSILPVRIAYSKTKGSNWVTSDSWIVRSIDWAWQQGADVISNSWGGGAPSSAVEQAIKRAQTQGRNKKGSVVIIAAGNEAGPVSFPGTVPGVLTVSASNEYDEFKTKTSRDGESWWGSNFGPEVSLAAPGVHNLTTDNSGAAGYTNNHYTDFNGTSSATPIVAGAAGLILSANKNLTGRQVHDILTRTADKVGPYAYTNGRNDQFGYGRLNLLAAVLAANQLLVESPTSSSLYSMLHVMEQLNIPIKDNQTSSVMVVVGENEKITDISVLVKIEHTDARDLEIVLTPPFTVSAPIKLHDRQNTLQEEYRLSTLVASNGFLGKRSRGEWKLEVKDTAKKDEGKISKFGLRLGYRA